MAVQYHYHVTPSVSRDHCSICFAEYDLFKPTIFIQYFKVSKVSLNFFDKGSKTINKSISIRIFKFVIKVTHLGGGQFYFVMVSLHKMEDSLALAMLSK